MKICLIPGAESHLRRQILRRRISVLVYHMGHFYRSVIGMVEVGLLRFKNSLRIFDRRAAKESRVEASSDKNTRRPGAKGKRRISTEQDSSSEVSAPEDSPPGAERGGGLENKKLIISVHIPKTGGTTFLDVLKASVPDILYLDWGVGNTRLYRHGKRIPGRFQSLPDLESLPGRSVIHGHFGMGKYLSKFPEAIYVTWLRDPVERIASTYFFWQRRPYMDDPLCTKLITEKMTLEDFASLEQTRNLQYLSLAPAGVERFDFIGITEEYERSLELFRRLICPEVNVTPAMQNKNPSRLGNFYDLDPWLREKILKLNERDAYTYLDGLRRFRRLCEKARI